MKISVLRRRTVYEEKVFADFKEYAEWKALHAFDYYGCKGWQELDEGFELEPFIHNYENGLADPEYVATVCDTWQSIGGDSKKGAIPWDDNLLFSDDFTDRWVEDVDDLFPYGITIAHAKALQEAEQNASLFDEETPDPKQFEYPTPT